MILFPAIDLKDGQCVRLKLGDMEQATIFNDNPAAQAKSFEDQGFAWLHLVDLNGAFEGKPVNARAVEEILKAISIPVQLGGGIRDLATIERWLSRGVTRVILGTIALRNPAIVREACKEFPGEIVVGIDAKAGHVAVEGWGESSSLTAIELGKRFEDVGVTAIVFTDIDRDGILTGLNFDSTLRLAEAVSIPVIASGGLSNMADIEQLCAVEDEGVEGVICGRAIYSGDLDFAAAQARADELLSLIHISEPTRPY